MDKTAAWIRQRGFGFILAAAKKAVFATTAQLATSEKENQIKYMLERMGLRWSHEMKGFSFGLSDWPATCEANVFECLIVLSLCYMSQMFFFNKAANMIVKFHESIFFPDTRYISHSGTKKRPQTKTPNKTARPESACTRSWLVLNLLTWWSP